jgi:GxxExxY protein
MVELIYKEEVYAIVGAAMEVYNQLGPGFLEAVYQEALDMELDLRGIPHKSMRELPIYYKDRQLKKFYVADFIVFDCIILEIKAIDRISAVEESQLLNELVSSRMELGVLINFGAKEKLEWKRRILTRR